MTLALAVLLTLSPMSVVDLDEATSGCSRGDTIQVFRIHRRGSDVPARVERWKLRDYVAAVAASGAWPAYKPWASLQVGVVAIKQYARWMATHNCRRWRGRAFAITDSEQFLAVSDTWRWQGASPHPGRRESTWDVWLRRHGRMAKPHWSGNGRWCGDARTGNLLPEGGVTACARQGLGYRAILRRYLSHLDIVEVTR